MAYETRKLYVIRHKYNKAFLTKHYTTLDKSFDKARLFTAQHHATPKLQELGDSYELVEVTATIYPAF